MTELISISQAFDIKEIIKDIDTDVATLQIVILDISEVTGLSALFEMYPLPDYDTLLDMLIVSIVEGGYRLDELVTYLEEAEIFVDQDELAVFIAAAEAWTAENANLLATILPNLTRSDENFSYIGAIINPHNTSQATILYSCSKTSAL